jgi:hypothetical protein
MLRDILYSCVYSQGQYFLLQQAFKNTSRQGTGCNLRASNNLRASKQVVRSERERERERQSFIRNDSKTGLRLRITIDGDRTTDTQQQKGSLSLNRCHIGANYWTGLGSGA